MINQVDAVVPSLNTLYSQRFKGSIGYQPATKVTDQGLSGSNSYIKLKLKLITFGIAHHRTAMHFQVHLTVRNKRIFNTHNALMIILSCKLLMGSG